MIEKIWIDYSLELSGTALGIGFGISLAITLFSLIAPYLFGEKAKGKPKHGEYHGD